jgi:hypothetical protein
MPSAVTAHQQTKIMTLAGSQRGMAVDLSPSVFYVFAFILIEPCDKE